MSQFLVPAWSSPSGLCQKNSNKQNIMKFIRTAFLALIAMFALALGAFAGDTNTVASVSPYKANEFAVSTFGTYQASGAITGDSQWGAGIQADYFVTKNIGVTLATSKNRFDDGAFFQNLSIGPVIRLPIKDTGFAPYVLGGIGFDFDHQNDRFYYAGGGVEYRPQWFLKHVSVFTDAQYQWRDYLQVGNSEAVVTRAGLRWTF